MTQDITTILPSLLSEGIKTNVNQSQFKDLVNHFFRRKTKSMEKYWKDAKLELKFDDRLNMFFLYNEYTPKLGFYLQETDQGFNKIYLVKFNNGQLTQAIGYVVAFAESLKKRKEKEV